MTCTAYDSDVQSFQAEVLSNEVNMVQTDVQSYGIINDNNQQIYCITEFLKLTGMFRHEIIGSCHLCD